MKTRVGLCAGLLVVAGWTAGAWAQGVPCPSCAGPHPYMPGPVAGQPTTPGATTTPTNPSETQPSQQDQNQASQQNNGEESNPFGGQGSSQSGVYGGTLTAGGTGLASATATGGGGVNNGASEASSPLLLPGLFTSAQAESARPVDRVFFSYGYFNGFRATVAAPNPTVSATGQFFQSAIVRGFNLNVFNLGVEKTFFDGRVSAIVRVPLLDAADNVTGQPIDGIGDISAGLKAALLLDCETGSALSVGLDVDAPTGRDQVFTINQSSTNGGLSFAPGASTKVNPTFLQPYVSGVVNLNGLSVQNFLGVLVSTDGRISPFINEDLQVGYQLFRCPDRMLSSVTPTLEAQALLPTAHEGSGGVSGVNITATNPTGLTSVSAFNFPDQLFLTEGVQLGLGCRSVLSLGVVEPVVGPKAFTVGGTVGLNFFY